jgi:hypothetical protein
MNIIKTIYLLLNKMYDKINFFNFYHIIIGTNCKNYFKEVFYSINNLNKNNRINKIFYIIMKSLGAIKVFAGLCSEMIIDSA